MKTENTYDVLVIGAGITGLTTALYVQRAGLRVAILEQASRVGGQIQTKRADGFVCECGPNTGVLSYPEIKELFQDISLDVQVATEANKIRHVWKKNRFYPLPSSLYQAVTTPLFTWKDKFRILGEPWRKPSNNPDESVGDLVARRLGQSYLDNAVDPFISGIYAGDVHRLVTRYALPKLYALEANHGSFIRGAIAKHKETKTQRDKLATKEVFSVRGGLQTLTDRLGEQIGAENVFLGVSDAVVHPIIHENGIENWEITGIQNGASQVWQAARVVTTVGAYSLSSLLPFVPQTYMQRINNVRYAPVTLASVSLTHLDKKKHQSFIRTVQAFGSLVPSHAQCPILGILYPSSCFDDRCPAGTTTNALLSFFIGGIRYPDVADWTSTKIDEVVREGLYGMLHMPEDITYSIKNIAAHKHAIPQYEITSGERFQAIDAMEQEYPGLTIAGNLRDGIGLGDRIRQGRQVAEKIKSSFSF